MKRLALSLIVLIGLLGGQAFAQQSTVAAIRNRYPTPLGARHGAFLLEVACATGKGLLRKDGGTNILLADGTRVAQDIVMERDGRHYDILGDGEGAAVPHWELVTEPPTVDPSRYYAPPCGAPAPNPEPRTPNPAAPDPGIDWPALIHEWASAMAGLEAKVDALTTELRELKARQPPAYSGSFRVLGQPVTFTLRPQ